MVVVGVKERRDRFDRRGADYAAASKHGAGGKIDRVLTAAATSAGGFPQRCGNGFGRIF
jgi:hypothetical protein